MDDYIYWMFESGGGFYDPVMECPDGCSTFGLGFATRNKVRDAIDNYIRRDLADCRRIADYLNGALGADRISNYPQYADPGALADIHFNGAGNDPTKVDIHVSNDNYADVFQLAYALAHEAGHGLDWPYDTENSASSYANLCTRRPV